MSLLSDSLLISPLSNQGPIITSSIYLKLGEAILKNPKSLSDNDTKLSLVEKSINEIDDIGSKRLQTVEILYLSNN